MKICLLWLTNNNYVIDLFSALITGVLICFIWGASSLFLVIKKAEIKIEKEEKMVLSMSEFEQFIQAVPKNDPLVIPPPEIIEDQPIQKQEEPPPPIKEETIEVAKPIIEPQPKLDHKPDLEYEPSPEFEPAKKVTPKISKEVKSKPVNKKVEHKKVAGSQSKPQPPPSLPTKPVAPKITSATDNQIEVGKKKLADKLSQLINEEKFYPKVARRAGYEGVLFVDVEVDQEGKIIHYQIQGKRCHRSLQQALEKVFNKVQERYQATQKFPYPVKIRIPVSYQLR